MRCPRHLWVLVLAALPAAAQESASYRLVDHALNAGGVPAQGEIHVSAQFRLTLEAIAGPVGHLNALSKGYDASGGLIAGLLPPTEVQGLAFTDGDTLTWNGHAAAGAFRLYREGLDGVAAAFTCLTGDVPGPTADDGDAPSAGQGFAYLVTVTNTLGEEGTPGSTSNGTPRTLAGACP